MTAMAKIVGTDANDTLRGTDEDDSIWSLGGNDVLTASSGFDRLDGGEGDDRLVLNGVGGAATGGAGVDTLVIDLSATTDRMYFDGLKGHNLIGNSSDPDNHIYVRDIERLELKTSSGDDSIRGGTGDDIISTGDGDDIIGARDSEEPSNSYGNDIIDGGAGIDYLTDKFGANHLFGGAGNDEIKTTLASAELDGGDGIDWLWLYDGARTDGVTINFEDGIASTGTTFRDFENGWFEMGSGSDTIVAGNLLRLTAFMGGGDDTVTGSAGSDYLNGEAGNDSLFGGIGFDKITGGEGADHIEGGAHNDNLDGGIGNDVLLGGTGDDRIYGGEGEDHIEGGAGNDFLWARYDFLTGGTGNDELLGGEGNDQLFGSTAADTLRGGSGADILEGKLGADILEGGTDADTFVWHIILEPNGGIDHITDFDIGGGDLISLQGFASNSSSEIRDFEGFIAASHDTAGGVFVALEGDTNGVLIENVTLTDLSADDVVFV